MTIREASDLGKKVERYEIALDELRIAHQDVKGVLVEGLLIERLQQLGGDLGFSVAPREPALPEPESGLDRQRELAALNLQLPELTDSWSG
jgi:hypothetical protein